MCFDVGAFVSSVRSGDSGSSWKNGATKKRAAQVRVARGSRPRGPLHSPVFSLFLHLFFRVGGAAVLFVGRGQRERERERARRGLLVQLVSTNTKAF